jgi:hypothetical protein
VVIVYKYDSYLLDTRLPYANRVTNYTNVTLKEDVAYVDYGTYC